MISVPLFILFFAVPPDKYSSFVPDPKTVKTKENILEIQNLIELFKKDNMRYPTTDEGLDALVRNPDPDKYPGYKTYIQSLPMDPWGKHYQFLSPGTHGDFDIYSFGVDGKQSDDDIGSWELGTRIPEK